MVIGLGTRIIKQIYFYINYSILKHVYTTTTHSNCRIGPIHYMNRSIELTQ